MADVATQAAAGSEPERRRRVLDAALGVFARYGFRKTSMEEVARAADISRQGLYLHFRNKEDLFRAAILKMMEDGLAAVDRALAGEGELEDRLLAAMVAWYGRSATAGGGDRDDLFARSVDLVGADMERYGQAVLQRLTEALAVSAAAKDLARRGVDPAEAALTLQYVGLGLKHEPISPAQFEAMARAAVRLVTR